ncbi:serine/threonine protein kinase [Peptococcaceae bacterium]|nr:serine/threonine protein kinase [Peptococcaceae bacterium]
MIIISGNREIEYPYEKEIVSISSESYELADYIGRGGNATVYECINSNGNILAIKFILQLKSKRVKRFEQEINALKKINHPHIIQYLDEGSLELTNVRGQKIKIMFLIMEKADSNLVDYMKVHQTIGYEIYAPQFRGLSEALAELHNFAIHRDIKPENILVKGETWLISDLGLCSFLDETEHLDLTTENEKIGPKYWLSPEAINKFYFQNDEIFMYSDVYQLCAVFWFVVTHRHPTGILSEQDWKGNDQNIYDLVIKSLAHDFKQRPQTGSDLYKLVCKATLSK